MTSKGRQRILRFETKSTIYKTKNWGEWHQQDRCIGIFSTCPLPEISIWTTVHAQKYLHKSSVLQYLSGAQKKYTHTLRRVGKTVSHYLSPFPKPGQPNMERDTLRYLYTFNGINGKKKKKNKKSENTKCWRECRETGSLINCWREYIIVQPL